ncbi:MAG: site-2 protease family protein [Bdellovibrionales bacterium]
MEESLRSRNGIGLFQLSGIRVRLDWTWLFLAALVIWSLTTGYFPMLYPHQPAVTYWALALFSAVGLFASIIAHEFGHAWVGRQYGLPIRSIRLFIFGGVAEMDEEPPSAKSEFLMAAAGPAASIGIGVFLGMLGAIGWQLEWSFLINAILTYLGAVNLLLALFNLVPAFPLDGGRILRAALWAWTRDLRWATRIASRVGRIFGWMLVALGLLDILAGAFVGGLWLVLIGLFVQGMASLSYRGTVLRQTLRGLPMARFVRSQPVTIPPDLTVEQAVSAYFTTTYHELYPVMDGERVIGCLTVERISQLPRERWGTLRVRDVMMSLPEENTVAAEADVTEVLKRGSLSRGARFLVIDRAQSRLVGIVSVADLLKALRIRERLA